MGESNQHNRFSSQYVNLASARLGAKAVFTTDEFFAPCERMLQDQAAVFVPGKFDDHGKWMDGWETRRKRQEGYDHCIIRLGKPGSIVGVDIDTSHFNGNQPKAASIDACLCDAGDPDDSTQWTVILPSVGLEADSHHLHDIEDNGTYSHLRLNIYPDGGIARLRVYGHPRCNWNTVAPDQLIDLAALEYGGLPIACSDQAFGSSILNLNMPGRGINMGDGWETKRRRVPGNEWVILQLGHTGIIKAIELDTAHYKGNFPDRASVQAGYVRGGTLDAIVTQSMFWQDILAPQQLHMDRIHRFEDEVVAAGPVTHVRVNILPDGGLSRVRLFGHITG